MKHYLFLAFKSMFLFLIVCWSAALSLEECVWIETISFYFLALYEVKGSKESKEALFVCFALIAGRIALEISIRLMDYEGSLGSLPITIANLVAIPMGCIAGKKGDTTTNILSLLVVYCSNILSIHVLQL